MRDALFYGAIFGPWVVILAFMVAAFVLRRIGERRERVISLERLEHYGRAVGLTRLPGETPERFQRRIEERFRAPSTRDR